MSTFDPNAFLQTTIDQALDTSLTPVPVGDRIGVVVGEPSVRQFTANTTGITYTTLELTWEFSDEETRKVTGREKATARQSVFLDITPEGGLDIGKGKNVQLGALRDAVGQNVAGRPWGPMMLIGATGLCHVEHQTPAGDANATPFARVTRVAKMR